MLRNKAALPILQKTYDESYLTCSTAVYYEGQGDETEAMRCWKSALDNIHDHQAHKVTPNYVPKTETEKALIESLNKLELQCKERIDLLEALRISRADDANSNPRTPNDGPLTENLDPFDPQPRRTPSKGWIGDGTIPAITYPELSRPALPPRPSFVSRSSSERAVVGKRYTRPEIGESSSTSRLPSYYSEARGRKSRSPSPEKYTMRTTLRSGKPADRSVKRRSVPRMTDEPGASKAATMAWSALGLKDRASQGRDAETSTERKPRSYNDTPEHNVRKTSGSPAPRQWDSHTRRLVRHRSDEDEEETHVVNSLELKRSFERLRPDDLHSGASALSVGAASSALSGLPAGSRDSERTPRHRPRLDRPTKSATRPAWDEDMAPARPQNKINSSTSLPIHRKPSKSHRDSPGGEHRRKSTPLRRSASDSSVEESDSGFASSRPRRKVSQRERALVTDSQGNSRSQSRHNSEESAEDESTPEAAWKKRKSALMKNLPPGVDKNAAKQILNEIIVQGDEVRWTDIAGLEVAKNALREAVVYPFLRPDLFMGLREPARGMLLFGPPGTGKTMLARAVATESKSTFFSISASSLTSKYLGESEKLVRALFGLAKVLAPSIIFVDEIDSLLSQRSGSGEHEATRRIKTEFLIQWSDLQRAAAGRESGDKDRGDANRVLVLAATNLPWAIDEAARRRFVRRQYIPLPEPETRAIHLKHLLGQQNYNLTDEDFATLVELTDGFSGSDITALAKDAAMGPLRSLGEALLHMTMEDIRPIELTDFVASLATIRPSVSKSGIKQHEDWADEFGERGG
ncbi:hypothetical protein N0V93_008601 [Gnomoniopsis smithogilvyi]|uniref:AAA+ ATPase domain-containing protein n=1 Tax=Gnomoniopsis smithogilvyi TaxID=1191159 RepID=A0A9W8YPG8_9PEZI|nr:hypothetical protein N0V93_008601 [Gnomoniopsis smithogilvyi]